MASSRDVKGVRQSGFFILVCAVSTSKLIPLLRLSWYCLISCLNFSSSAWAPGGRFVRPPCNGVMLKYGVVVSVGAREGGVDCPVVPVLAAARASCCCCWSSKSCWLATGNCSRKAASFSRSRFQNLSSDPSASANFSFANCTVFSSTGRWLAIRRRTASSCSRNASARSRWASTCC